MSQRPVILVSPSTERSGVEFADASISLSDTYARAILDHGGLPVVMTAGATPETVADYVRHSDGILLTGGDDVASGLYTGRLSAKLAKTVSPPEPERDYWELLLIDEVFRQRKPLLAICRGHQILNVALGGTLVTDIETQMKGKLAHKQLERKWEQVHDIISAPGSLMAAILGTEPIGVNSTHHQAVGRISPLLKCTAKSPDGIIEAMELKSPDTLPYLLSVQFHPERLYDRFARFGGIFASFVAAVRATRGGNDSKDINSR